MATKNPPGGVSLTATLEGLVRKGVITDFQLPPDRVLSPFRVIVTAPVVTNPNRPDYDRETVERVRRRVAREVKPFRGDRDVLISVRGLR
jgi:hypothetical protein